MVDKNDIFLRHQLLHSILYEIEIKDAQLLLPFFLYPENFIFIAIYSLKDQMSLILSYDSSY